MKLEFNELENGIRLIELIGALDLSGRYSIEIEFVRQCAGEGVRVLVDLSEVDYISSIGVHMLISSANSIASPRRENGSAQPSANRFGRAGVNRNLTTHPNIF